MCIIVCVYYRITEILQWRCNILQSAMYYSVILQYGSNIVLQYCTGILHFCRWKVIKLSKYMICTKFNQLSFCPHWSDHVTLMPKYGHKTAPGSVSTPKFFVISVQKMTWNNCSYLLPQALPSTPPPPFPAWSNTFMFILFNSFMTEVSII